MRELKKAAAAAFLFFLFFRFLCFCFYISHLVAIILLRRNGRENRIATLVVITMPPASLQCLWCVDFCMSRFRTQQYVWCSGADGDVLSYFLLSYPCSQVTRADRCSGGVRGGGKNKGYCSCWGTGTREDACRYGTRENDKKKVLLLCDTALLMHS